MDTTTDTTCVRCGGSMPYRNDAYQYCRTCFYTGNAHHRDAYAPLMAQFQLLPQVASVYVCHTGGGCFGLAVQLSDSRYAFMTDAYYDETTGALEYDATLDNGPDGLHCMVLYPSEDAFYDDNESTVLEYGTGPHLVEWLAGHIFLAHEQRLFPRS